MAHGGKRDGAGRPLGSPNKATKERQAKVASTGATPLDVLIQSMRYHHAAALELMAISEPTDDEKLELRAELNLAGSFAADAAPYVHPRLAQIDAKATVEHRFVIEVPALPANSDQWQQQFAPNQITKLPGGPNGHNSH